MNKIVIEIPSRAAKKWKAASTKRKKEIAALVAKNLQENNNLPEDDLKPGYARPSEAELQKHMAKVKESRADYMAFLDRIGKEAAARGLTQEILDKLLAEDD